MSKLNKHQQRRIHANREQKLEGNLDTAALVVAHLGYQIIVDNHGELLAADWRKQTGTVCVNDRVHLSHNKDGSAVVEGIYPRGNTLYKWQGRKTKPIASHLDQILIVIAVEPEWQSPLIDRYLIAALEANINTAILLNKIELANTTQLTDIKNRLSPYTQIGTHLFYASIKNNNIPPELQDWLHGKQTILCGQSGVGKSSLIRHYLPNADIWIQSLSQATGLGRHTTTNVRRYPIAPQTAIIDTPGVRGYAVTHLEKDTILAGFPDITKHAANCKFNDCSHTNEPHCNVQEALKTGDIHLARYNSMQQLLQELTGNH